MKCWWGTAPISRMTCWSEIQVWQCLKRTDCYLTRLSWLSKKMTWFKKNHRTVRKNKTLWEHLLAHLSGLLSLTSTCCQRRLLSGPAKSKRNANQSSKKWRTTKRSRSWANDWPEPARSTRKGQLSCKQLRTGKTLTIYFCDAATTLAFSSQFRQYLSRTTKKISSLYLVRLFRCTRPT